jgi:hypothetical protein
MSVGAIRALNGGYGRSLLASHGQPELRELSASASKSLERATRIELAFSAWEADVLPLNYARGESNDNARTMFATAVAYVFKVAMSVASLD